MVFSDPLTVLGRSSVSFLEPSFQDEYCTSYIPQRSDMRWDSAGAGVIGEL